MQGFLIVTVVILLLALFIAMPPAMSEPTASVEIQKLVNQFIVSTITMHEKKFLDVQSLRATEITWQRLKCFGDAGREALVPLLQHENPLVRIEAAARLLRFRYKDAVSVLQAANKEKLYLQYHPECILNSWEDRSWRADVDPNVAPITTEQLKNMIDNAGLGKYRDKISALAQYAIKIDTVVADDGNIPVGASKLGGMPDLPAETAWPMYHDKPLAFIAQIQLSDIAALDQENRLPHEGMLYFFYFTNELTFGDSIEDRGSAVILYNASSSTNLRRRNFPKELGSTFSPCQLTFRRMLSLPWEDAEVIDQLHLTAKELKRYNVLIEKVAKAQWVISPHADGIGHQLFGYPKLFQPGDILSSCPKLKPGAQWQLLFQIGSEEYADMMWGDSGCLYFCIAKPDSETALTRFTTAWVILECY